MGNSYPKVPQKAPLFINSDKLITSTTLRTNMAHNNSFNTTNSYNKVCNNCAITDGEDQLFAWLSPLEPRLRHQDIRGGRVGNVGEWVLQTEEFRNWYTSGGRSESDNAVLFCYGDPGVGKTFLRYKRELDDWKDKGKC